MAGPGCRPGLVASGPPSTWDVGQPGPHSCQPGAGAGGVPRSLPRDLRVGWVDPTREAGDCPEDSGIGRWAARGSGDTPWFWAPGPGRCSRWGVTAASTSESLRPGPWLPLSPQTNPSWFIPTASRTQADSESPEPSGHAGASWRKGLCNPALRDGVWGLGHRLF